MSNTPPPFNFSKLRQHLDAVCKAFRKTSISWPLRNRYRKSRRSAGRCIGRHACLFPALACLALFFASPLRADNLRLLESASAIEVYFGEKLLLSYNKESPRLPADIDPVYARSGFIHPINTLNGKTLSDSFPKDHPHQDGLFSAWVKTTYKGQSVDFWNLGGKTGRVLHESVKGTSQENDRVSFEVTLIHRAEGTPSTDVLREHWKISVHLPKEDYYTFDIESVQEALTATPLVVEKYHYGGMAFRGNSRWLRPNDRDRKGATADATEACNFLNSQGQDRPEGNHVPTSWVALNGILDASPVSLVVRGDSGNLFAPQPARLHDTKPYFCFSPCVVDAFEIRQDKPLRSKYYYLVRDSKVDVAWINEHFRDSSPPKQP